MDARRALLIVLVAAGAAGAAPRTRHEPPKPPDKPAEAPPPPSAPIDPAAQAILDRIAKGDAKAAADLDKLAPKVVDGLGTFLARTHVATLDDRRKALETIKAAVPDKTGHFKAFERKSEKEEKADDELDWMAGLVALDAATPGVAGLGEVMADDAAIRALASTRDIHAAALLFDTAFRDETIIYRDEIGRYLRKMSVYAIPALMQESQAKNFDRKRYATYQLERLDRQEPGKALTAATGDEALTVAILDVFRVIHHREAVHAVWSRVNADSPRIRAKARETWMAYITGPPPPPAPRMKLKLPGGKLTKKEKPLWLTYRELADNELRKAANELLQEDYPLDDPTLDDTDEWRKKKTVKVDLEELTAKLFKFYDDARAKQEAAQWDAAKALADKGDLAGATAVLDRLLAANPDRGNRPAMATVFFAWAKQLEAKAAWADAAAAYSKAYGLDPKGKAATDALAAHHYSLGKALEAQGKDGGPDFRKAVALRPDYAPAQTAARDVDRAGRPVWMLYVAGSAALLALVLFGAAMVRRRA